MNFSQQTKEEEQKDAEPKSRPKVERKWVTISNKVNKKDMNSVVVNLADEDAQRVNIEAEMEKYLGGEDEVLQGFYESDEEVKFDSIGSGSSAAASTSGQSLFSRLTGAF